MANDPRAVRQYLENQIRTASREQLLLLLFDGAIRFSEQARHRLAGREIEEGLRLLVRAQHVVLEVMNGLDRGVGEELYRNLVGLYGFVYGRLVRAGTTVDPAPIDEALVILRRLRETWGDAVMQMRQEQASEAAATVTQSTKQTG